MNNKEYKDQCKKEIEKSEEELKEIDDFATNINMELENNKRLVDYVQTHAESDKKVYQTILNELDKEPD